MTISGKRVLYISYNGMLDPLGQSQVIPYLRELSTLGVSFTLLSYEREVAFTPEGIERCQELKQTLAAHSIEWHYLRYHKSPSLPATLYDVAAGVCFGASIMRRHKIKMIHARGYIPAAIALALKKLFGVKMIFDIRGLMGEEYVDAAHWSPGSFYYRWTKIMERRALAATDGIVTLTHKLWPVIREWDGLRGREVSRQVIPCCTDLERFAFREEDRLRRRAELGLDGRFVVVYSGSIGSWYLSDKMADLFLALLKERPDAHFLWLTQGDPELIKNLIRLRAIDESQYTIRSAQPVEVASYLSASDMGIAFFKPGLSKLATSPTKVGEYLACGLPVIMNAGIGDSDVLVTEESAGALVENFTSEDYERAIKTVLHLLEDVEANRKHMRGVAERLFDVTEVGRSRYARLYEDVIGSDQAQHVAAEPSRITPPRGWPMALEGRRVLFISYNGMLDPLGQSQVLPYLRELSKKGVQFTLLSFERTPAFESDGPARCEELRRQLGSENIDWHWLRYHQKPSLPATVYDVLAGVRYARQLVERNGIEMVHARSYIPATIGLALKKRFGLKLIFDVRGLMADEYVDAEHWRRGSIPDRLTKSMERRVFAASDGIVTLTEKIWPFIRKWDGLDGREVVHEVIPCCVDLRRFKFGTEDRLKRRIELGVEGRFVVVYSGSIDGWYLTEEMADFFAGLIRKSSDAHCLWLTPSRHDRINALMKERGADPGRYTILGAAPKDVPSYLSASDAGLAFIKPCFSKLASSPIKNGEYLACGLPIIINAGIGDSDQLIVREKVGALIGEFTAQEYDRAVTQVLSFMIDVEGTRGHVRGVAERLFDVREVGTERYARLYEEVLESEEVGIRKILDGGRGLNAV